jgi:hypothetical protein
MTSTPINLNRARKQRARAEAKTHAAENAVRFGRSKAQKSRENAEADKAAKAMDAHKLDP